MESYPELPIQNTIVFSTFQSTLILTLFGPISYSKQTRGSFLLCILDYVLLLFKFLLWILKILSWLYTQYPPPKKKKKTKNLARFLPFFLVPCLL